MKLEFDFLLFVDGNYRDFFVHELYSIMPNSIQIIKVDQLVYLAKNVKLSDLNLLSRLGTLKSLGLIIPEFTLEFMHFLFENFRSRIGYFIPFTYSMKKSRNIPSTITSSLRRIFENIKPKPHINYRYPQLIFEYFHSQDHKHFIVHLPVARDFFLSRDPQYRPFSPPTSLPAVLTRILVNFSQAFPGNRFLDPFCGTGTIAIDAASIGANSYCIDKNEKILLGARLLSKYYDLDIKISVGDARNLFMFEEDSIDAIATDPPYGIGSSTFGISLNELYYGFLLEAYRVLKKNKTLVLCHIPQVPVESFADQIGFEITYQLNMKVHSRLTRIITGLVKR